MPDTLRKSLTDLITDTVDAYFNARINALENAPLQPGERQTRIDYLRNFIANAPADFPSYAVRVDRMTHSGWTRSGSLAGDQSDYLSQTDEFPVIRTARVVVTIREEMPDDEEPDTHLGDAMVDALFASGPFIGTDGHALGVRSTGEPEVETRETRDNESPQPGVVHTVTFTVTAQQWGRALRTAINTI
jgi:hypothetical protein